MVRENGAQNNHLTRQMLSRILGTQYLIMAKDMYLFIDIIVVYYYIRFMVKKPRSDAPLSKMVQSDRKYFLALPVN